MSRRHVTELTSLLWLLSGVAVLGGASFLGASCLRLHSVAAFVAASYLLAWAAVVATACALSPMDLLTRGWLLSGFAAALLAAALLWHTTGRPRPPPFGPALAGTLGALRHPANLILAVAIALGAGYTSLLAFFIPQNDGDALSYHLARAAFWKQAHGLGYVPGAEYTPLNGHPPNAEIGQVATMVLADNDRYVALPQFAAYGVLVVCVAALARRLALSREEAVFAALAFAAFPIVAVQASTALNDLVVASFLAVATIFVLERGRVALVVFGLALGLALSTKLVAVLALPTMCLIAAVGRPRRDWIQIALAGAAAAAAGSWWYVVNLVETGRLDGGLSEELDQAQGSVAGMVITALRLALDMLDFSGGPWPHRLLFLIGAAVLAVAGTLCLYRSRRVGIGLLGAAVLTAGALLTHRATDVGQDFVFRAWVAIGRPETAPFEFGWKLNVEADPAASWYGPLGVLLVTAGAIAVAYAWARGRLPLLSLVFVLAPWTLLATLAVVVVWDPFRGRFLIYGVAVAAAACGFLLRFPTAAGATAVIASTSLLLSFANYLGKPSGLDALWPRDPPLASTASIWGADRVEAQTRLRPGEAELPILRYIADEIGPTSSIAIAPRANEFLSPYFGERLSRRVQLVPTHGRVPPDAEWLVLAPGARVRTCGSSWQTTLRLGAGWRIARRVHPDGCILDRNA